MNQRTDWKWNRERMIEVLRWVASPAAVQRAAIAFPVVLTDELVQSIEDEILVMPGLKAAGLLSDEEERAMRTVDAVATALVKSDGWDAPDALETAPAWESLRKAVGEALVVFGADSRPPRLTWV